jgi:hypothetical protein
MEFRNKTVISNVKMECAKHGLLDTIPTVEHGYLKYKLTWIANRPYCTECLHSLLETYCGVDPLNRDRDIIKTHKDKTDEDSTRGDRS